MALFKSWWAKVTRAGNSTLSWFKQQITYRGKVSNSVFYFPYGFHANTKVDKTTCVWFGINGDASNKLGFAWDAQVRPDLKEGEVAFYQPETNTIIWFDVDGNINIHTDVDINATCENINVTATTKATVTAPESEFVGNVTVSGNLTVTGNTALSSTVTSNGTNISDTHTHTGSATAPTGGVSNTGTPT